MKKMSKSVLKKFLSLFLAVTFLVSQNSFALAQGVDFNTQPQEESPDTLTKTADQAESQDDTTAVLPGGFLEQGPLQVPAIETTLKEEEEIRKGESRELERYGFNRAIASLQDNLATAVVLNKLSEKNLKKLLELKMEVGIAVLHGEIILFTSGNTDEIYVQKPILDLLKDANFVSHTHPESSDVADGPSSADIALGVANPSVEHVVTTKGVYSYNHSGPLNGGVPSDYKEFIKNLYDALREDRQTEPRSSVLARQALNEFIYQMDLLNNPATRNDELFRSSGTLAPDATKTATNITALPGTLRTTTVSPAGATASMSPDARTSTLTYNTGAGGYSGGGFSYDDFTTGPIETQDLSGLTQIVLGLKGNTTQIKLEVVDNLDRKAFIYLSGISSVTQQFWTIPISQLVLGATAGFDLTKVRLLYFIVEGAGKSGTLDIQVEPTLLSVSPSASLTAADITPLPGNPQIAPVSSSPATAVMSSMSLTTSTLTYNTSSVGWAGGGYSFDDFVTVPIETVNLSSLTQLVFGLKGNPSQVKFEIIDDQGKKTSIQLTGITSTQQIWAIPTSQLAGIDLTKIRLFYFIVEGASQAGTLDIEIKTIPTTPTIAPSGSLTAADLTLLPGNPQVTPVSSNPATASMNATSSTTSTLTYNTSSVGWAGGGYTFDDFGTASPIETVDLSSITQLVVGLKGNPSQVKFELLDNQDKKATVILTGMTGTEQFWAIPKTQLTGIDLTKVRLFYFIVEGTNSAGTLDIEIKKAPEPPQPPSGISSSDTLTTADITKLPGNPQATPVSSNPATASMNVTSSTTSTLTYNTSSVGWAGGGYSFDDFGTASIETVNLSGLSQLVFGLKGAPTQVKFELIDDQGKKASVNLINILSGVEKVWAIPVSQLTGIDLTKVRLFYFIVEGVNQTGTLDIEIKRPAQLPAILPTAGLTLSKVTVLPPLPAIPAVQFIKNPANHNSVLAQPVPEQLQVNYAALGNGEFVGPSIDLGAAGRDLTKFTNFIFGASGPTGGTVKVEFKDADGDVSTVLLTSLSSVTKFYQIPALTLKNANAAFNITKVSRISFIVDNGNVGTDPGTFSVFLKGQQFNASYNHNSALTAANVSTFPVNTLKKQPRAQLLFGAEPFPKNNFSQTNTQQVSVDYDISTGTTFSGTTVSFDNALTSTIETAVWPKTLANLVVGLKGPAGGNSRVKVEFVNSAGLKKEMFLNDVTNVEQFYQIPLTLFGGFLKKSIRYINFVIDTASTPDLTNTLDIRMEGLYFYEQKINADPALTATSVTTLPLTPFTTILGGSSGNSSYAQTGTGSIELLYDTSNPNSFSGSTISFDDYTTPAVEIANLGSITQFVFGASSSSGGSVVIQFVDSQGRFENRVLTNLTANEKFYKITKTTFDIIDWTKIQQINIIAEDIKLPNDQGTIKVSIKGLKDPKVLTAPQTALKQQILNENLKYFNSNLGVDPTTQFPYDHVYYSGDTATPNKYTQPTAIGFHAQILADVIRGRAVMPGVTKLQALTKLETLITKLSEAQVNPAISRDGLLLTFISLDNPLNPVPAVGSETIGLGDNSNMAQSLAVMMGALEGGVYTSSELLKKNAILTKATTVLAKMAPGFQKFYDGVNPDGETGLVGYFYHDRNILSGTYSSGHVNRMTNEFRATVAFLVSYYGDAARFPGTPITQAAWTHLNANLAAYQKDYQDVNGDTIPNAVPYHGGAFQMFWPLLRANEENYVEMTAMLKNFLYSAADYAARNNIPGFPSAGMIPGTAGWNYGGNIGINELSEAFLSPGQEATVANVGSLYGLASAYAVDPQFVLNWFDAILKAHPEIVSPALGFYDSVTSDSEVGKRHFAIDQASIVLAMTNTGGDDFDVFMKNRGLDAGFRNLYRGVDMGLSLANKIPSAPPAFPSETLTVFNNFNPAGSEGTVNLQPGDPFPVTTTEPDGIGFNYSGQTTDGGHYWELTQDYDASGAELRIDYSVTTTPQVFKIVLRDINDVILGTYTVNVDASEGIHTKTFQLPASITHQAVRRVHLIVEPTLTLVQTAKFFVHQIQFRRFNGPEALLTASSITTLPLPAPAVDSFSGGVGGADSLKYFNTSIIDLTYAVPQPDSYSAARLTFDAPGTPAVEFADFSTKDPLVMGLSGPGGAKVKVEFIDSSGKRSSIILSSLSSSVKFYKIRKSDLTGNADLTHITSVNVVIDNGLAGGSNAGTIRIVTEGLKPSNLILPDPSSTIANVTVLPTKPIVSGVSGAGGTVTATANINAAGTDTVTISYNISAGGFAGALLQYDAPTTTTKETKDLSSITNFVFGVKAPVNNSQVKVEFVDSTGAVKILYLQNAGTTEQFYKIPKSYLTGVNLKLITSINFIVDGALTTALTGTVTVQTNGL